MNHSIYSADRTTHLTVVIVALISGILVAGFGISMRNSRARDESRQTGNGHNVNAKRSPAVVTAANRCIA